MVRLWYSNKAGILQPYPSDIQSKGCRHAQLCRMVLQAQCQEDVRASLDSGMAEVHSLRALAAVGVGPGAGGGGAIRDIGRLRQWCQLPH